MAGLLDIWEKALRRLQKSVGNAGNYAGSQMGGMTGADYMKKKGPPLPPSRFTQPKVRAAGKGMLGLGVYEGTKQLTSGILEKTGGDKKLEGLGAWLYGDRMPMDYNYDTGRYEPRQGFKGLPQHTLDEIRSGKREAASPQSHELYTPPIKGTGRGGGGGGGGSAKDWQKRVSWLTEKLGLEFNDKNPFTIRGSRMLPHPSSISGQIGPENAAQLLAHIMTGTSHEIPATMNAGTASRKVALDEKLYKDLMSDPDKLKKLLNRNDEEED
jgi:hypothetical protein